MARVKIAAAFALCALSYYNFLHTYNQKINKKKMAKKEMVDFQNKLTGL